MQVLISSEQERQHYNGCVLSGWLYIYRDLGIEVDVKADKGKAILDRDYGHHQR